MKRVFVALSFAVLMAGGLTGCGEEDLERADFNAYFYFPDNNREEFLGLVKGLSACQRAAGGPSDFTQHESLERVVLHLLHENVVVEL